MTLSPEKPTSVRIEQEDFNFVLTDDGSYTLAISPEGQSQESEWMHNSQGALSETIYIYGRGIKWAKDNGLPPKFSIMGLGLGYIEMLAAAYHEYWNWTEPLQLISYENHPVLRKLPELWLLEPDSAARQRYNELFVFLDQIANLVALQIFGHEENAKTIKRCLADLLQTGRWKICSSQEISTFESSGIFYDAYSSQTSPELWDERFLIDFIQKNWSYSTCLATYAATGSLKRTLKLLGFEIHKSSGFGGKRESTFAVLQRSGF